LIIANPYRLTEIRYIIDTSSLIELSRSNPFDVYPVVWKKIEDLITTKRLIAPRVNGGLIFPTFGGLKFLTFI